MAIHETSQNRKRGDRTIEQDGRHDAQVADERQENAAKYREKVDELNRSRNVEIEQALTLRG